MSRPSAARLDRVLANLGYGSRREVQRLIGAGQVVLDGEALRDAGQRLPVTPDLTERMRVSGAPLDPPAPLTLILHKPLGVVCSHREPGRSVYELLPTRWRRRDPALSSVGRLDLDTTGLLLITDDGPLLHKVIAPRSHVAKRYHVTLDRPLQGHEGDLFAAGTLILESDSEPLAPAILEPLSPTTAHLTVTEGRYHQVRRMFAAAGNHVTALHRDRIGVLNLPDDLSAGCFHILNQEQKAAIFAARPD
ncbi:MAG: pseudouridine synthase [Pseudomonadota bacterium]|nr:pseudouridine synthase [Pseudomonadota bacterium]